MDDSKKDAAAEESKKKEEEMKAKLEAAEASFNEEFLEESSSDSEDEEMGLMERIKEGLREQQTAIIKAFVDYGPPYYPQEAKFELINECSEAKQKIFSIHSLLMARYDPNLRDPEDLYYTAGHWCGRNAHLMALKMLHRAKANFNLTNEFGQTTLHMACIVKQPADKIKNQKKIVEWLVGEFVQVDVNVVDKGGYAAIDYCCMNEQYDLIKILLRAGANVLRNNAVLVAKRKDLLEHIKDPECYRIVHLAVKKATVKFEAEEKGRRAIKAEQERQAKMARRQEELVQKKIKEWGEKQEAAERAYKAKVKKEKDDRIRKEMNTLSQTTHVNRLGGYTRDKNGKWHWHERVFKPSTEVVYAESRTTMKELRNKNKYEVFNERWNSITGGELEMEWRMSNAFDIDGLSDDEKIDDVEDEKSEYNENDEELQGMDLDDLF